MLACATGLADEKTIEPEAAGPSSSPSLATAFFLATSLRMSSGRLRRTEWRNKRSPASILVNDSCMRRSNPSSHLLHCKAHRFLDGSTYSRQSERDNLHSGYGNAVAPHEVFPHHDIQCEYFNWSIILVGISTSYHSSMQCPPTNTRNSRTPNRCNVDQKNRRISALSIIYANCALQHDVYSSNICYPLAPCSRSPPKCNNLVRSPPVCGSLLPTSASPRLWFESHWKHHRLPLPMLWREGKRTCESTSAWWNVLTTFSSVIDL